MLYPQTTGKNNVFILTGKTGSGKTSFLYSWCSGKNGVEGIITSVKNGKRILLNLADSEERILEVGSSFRGEIQKAGRYYFDSSAFDWAEDIISKTNFSEVDCFVLDEVGIPEMERKGFYGAVKCLLEKIKNHNTDVILVVREGNVESIKELFGFTGAEVFTKESFNYTQKVSSAYILCGGKSVRFGTDKALWGIKGKKIIEIIADAVKKVFRKTVLVTGEPEKYFFTGLECITDYYPGRGPLGGIHAALKHASSERVFIISCDMPLIKSDVIRFIAEYKTSKEVILPRAGTKNHYLCGVYSKKLLPYAEELLEKTKDLERSASPYDLISGLGFEIIDFNGLRDADIKCFFNLNTPEELKIIERINPIP